MCSGDVAVTTACPLSPICKFNGSSSYLFAAFEIFVTKHKWLISIAIMIKGVTYIFLMTCNCETNN
jgi:hypothetical protein